MKLQGLVLSLLLIQGGQAFNAYDCLDPDVTASTIDLTGPKQCDPYTNYADHALNTTVWVLHEAANIPQKVYRCKLTITRTVHRCGVHSTTYGWDYLAYDKIVPISPEDCRHVLRTGVLRYRNGGEFEVNPGFRGATTKWYYTHGGRTNDGSDYCDVTTWNEAGRLNKNSFAREVARLELDEMGAEVDLGLSKISLEHLTLDYNKGYAKDNVMGTLVWDVDSNTCNEHTTLVYKGLGSIAMDVDQAEKIAYEKQENNWVSYWIKNKQITEGSIALVKNPTTGQYGSFVIGKLINTCGRECYSTQMKDIKICVGAKQLHRTEVFEKLDILDRIGKDTNVDLVELESKIFHMHISTIQSIKYKLRMIRHTVCKLNAKSMANKLQAIAWGNHFAMLDVYGPGHMVVPAGAVAYVTKCKPVDVILDRTFENCTNDIPALLVDEKRNVTERVFVNPLTLIIGPAPRIVPCSPLYPTLAKIGDTWTSLGPGRMPKEDPITFDPNTLWNMTTEDMNIHLKDGIYGTRGRMLHKQLMVSILGREAYDKTATTIRIGEMGVNGHVVEFGYGEVSIGRIEDTIKGAFFPWAAFFGDWWTYMVGILILINMAKTFMNVSIRVIYTYAMEGCSITIIYALWDSLWMILRTPWEIGKKAAQEATGSRPKLDLEHPPTKEEKNYTKEMFNDKVVTSYRIIRGAVKNRGKTTPPATAPTNNDAPHADVQQELNEMK